MEIVSAIRSKLLERIGPDRFNVWFSNGNSIDYEAGSLTIAASSSFVLERIRNQFHRDLLEVVESHADQEVEVRYCVRSNVESEETDSSGQDADSNSSELQETTLQASCSAGRGRKFASLDSFAVGETNRVAFTVSESVGSRLGSVTPLVFHGPTGCGKTHLLEGIWSATRKLSSRRRIVMLSAEQFTSYFLEALQGSGLPSFRRKYRDADMLIIDDIQFFAGKRATLVELQHTLDTLLRQGRQIVLAGDRPPAEITGLGPELAARMSGGLVCGIEQPDESTRLAILNSFAKSRGMTVPPSVLELIAAELDGDARQLSGALNRLQATSQALAKRIDLELAGSALADVFRTARRAIHMPDIERAVCDVFGLDSKALQSDKKSNAVSHPRMLAMWLARRYTRAAYSEIGQYFGKRSHSTVISAQRKVENWVDDGTEILMAGGECQVKDALKRVELRLRTG